MYILRTTNNNGMKIAATAMGAFALGMLSTTSTANADKAIDNNHVRVEAGDTLGGIAQKHGTDVNTLVRDNHINNRHLIFVGDELVVTKSKKTKSVAKESNNESQKASKDTQETPSQNNNVVIEAPASSSAKDWIAQHESGGSYTASNGRYYGKFQLDSSYLNGDYSPANQERVADQYVANRYGSWEAAQAFWQSHGWY